MTLFKVLLQESCWIARWKCNGGWHGHTLVESSAMLFKTRQMAEKQLHLTMKYENKPFSQARIIEVTEGVQNV